ncbi:MAG: cadherin-like beta sandwich domain-containing protein [Bacilli bacterium]
MKKKKYILSFVMFFCLIMLHPKMVLADWADCHIQIEGDSKVSLGDTFVLSLGSDGVTYNTDIVGLHYVIEYYKDQLEPVSISDGGITSVYDWENIKAEIQDTNTRISYLIIDADTNNTDRYAYYNNLGTGYNKLLNVKFKVKSDAFGEGTFVRLMPTELSNSHYYPTSNLMSYKKVIYDGESELEACVDSPKVSVNFYKKAYLKSILINNSEIKNFNSDNYKYNITSNNQEITINANSEQGYSISGDIGKKTLKYGDNKFSISVTSPSGDKKTYTLNITREESTQTCNIKNLTIEGYNLLFEPEISNYKLNINLSDTSLKISVELMDKDSKYIISGNKNLENGSTITIKVEDKNGKEKNYYINILKESIVEEQSKENNLLPIIIIASIVTVMIVGLVFILTKRKK